MSIYYNNQLPGNLWLRDLTNDISPAYNVLSSIYIKYKNINSSFFSELTSNSINRFDVIFDTLFIETNSGCIFEKFYVDEYSGIQPYTQLNLFNVRKNTTIDYWYSESKNIIYFTELFYTQTHAPSSNKSFELNVLLKEINCNTGNGSTILSKTIHLGYLSATNWNYIYTSDNKWYVPLFTLENPKLTYNVDTKTFNVSFILRNSIGDFGLVSVNILDLAVPDISEFNAFLPYFTINQNDIYVKDWTEPPYNLL